MNMRRTLALLLCLMMLAGIQVPAGGEGSCAHKNTTSELSPVHTVIQKDADRHWYSYSQGTHVYCSDCGYEKVDNEVWTDGYAAHSFSGGACTVCGYSDSAACTHPENQLTFLYTDLLEVYVVQYIDDNQHGVLAYDYYQCKSCGEELRKETTSYSNHQYENGACWVCKRKAPADCDHTTKEKVVDTEIVRRAGDDSHHDVVKTYRIACACGKVSSEEDRTETVGCTFDGQTDAAHEEAGHRTYGKCACGNESSGSYKAFLSTCSVCQEKGLGRGSKGERVKELQRMLTALGLYTIAIDGDFGSGTQKAVDAFFEKPVEYIDENMLGEIRAAYDALTNPPAVQPETQPEGNETPTVQADWNTSHATVYSQGNRVPEKGTLLDESLMNKVLTVKDRVGGWFRMVAPADGDYVFTVVAPDLTRPTFSIVVSVDGKVYTSLQYSRSGEAQSKVVRGIKKGQVLAWWNNDDSGRGWTLQVPFKMMITLADGGSAGSWDGILSPDVGIEGSGTVPGGQTGAQTPGGMAGEGAIPGEGVTGQESAQTPAGTVGEGAQTPEGSTGETEETKETEEIAAAAAAWKFSVSEKGGSVVLNVEPAEGTEGLTGEYVLAVMPETYSAAGKVSFFDQAAYRLTEANGYRRGFNMGMELRLKKGRIYYFGVVPKGQTGAVSYPFKYAYGVEARILTPEEGDGVDLFTSGSMYVTWGPTEGAKSYELRILENKNGKMALICRKKVAADPDALIIAAEIKLADVQFFYSEADMRRDHNIQIQVSALTE